MWTFFGQEFDSPHLHQLANHPLNSGFYLGIYEKTSKFLPTLFKRSKKSDHTWS